MQALYVKCNLKRPNEFWKIKRYGVSMEMSFLNISNTNAPGNWIDK